MRPYQDADVCERTGAVPHRVDPACDELHLRGRGRDREGGTDEDDERAIGAQSDARAEVVARAAGRAVEPAVEAMRAGHDDAIGLSTVELDRLAPLGVVPQRHQVRLDAHQPLGGQVVPRGDTQGAGHTDPARCLDQVDLRRLVGYQRRDDEYVGVDAAYPGLDDGAARHRPLARLQRPHEPLGARGGGRGPTAQQPGQRGQYLPHPVAQIRRFLESGMQIPRIVDCAAQPARHRAPDVIAPRRLAEILDRSVHRLQRRQSFSLLVRLVEPHRDVVPALAQRLERRVEVAQIAGVLQDEEHLHRPHSARSRHADR